MRLGKVIRLETVTRKVQELQGSEVTERDEPTRVYGYLHDLNSPGVEIAFNPLKMGQQPKVGDTVGFLLDNRATDKMRAYRVYVGAEIEHLLNK